MENNNVRTMEFLGTDDWSMQVFKCIETGILYKKEEFETTLYTCGNDFWGEAGFPIGNEFEISFTGIPEQISKEQKFNYQLLDRLRSDCEYYLGYGNRNVNKLWANNEKEHIEKMKELYNSFSDNEKPEWLTYEQILQYEKLIINIK